MIFKQSLFHLSAFIFLTSTFTSKTMNFANAAAHYMLVPIQIVST